MDDGVLQFGRDLIRTGDLDPVYIYLQEKEILDHKLERWLLAYSMFYHVGVANKASQYTGDEFWNFVESGIPSTFPRGEERRHFRGHTASEAIASMRTRKPESIVQGWYEKYDFASVVEAVQKLKYYGPWIAFKMADMGERCLDIPIDFSNCELGIYKEPRQGAALVLTGDKEAKITDRELMEVVDYITINLNNEGYKAPPDYERPLNVQEAETILCKYKSYKGGHYYVGKDIESVKKALLW